MNGQTLEAWDLKPWKAGRSIYGRAHGGSEYRERPILQTPVDLWLFTELIQDVRPMLIVECGVFEGGFSTWLHDLTEDNSTLIVGIDKKLPDVYRESDLWYRLKGVEKDTLDSDVFHYLRELLTPDGDDKREPTLFILDDDHDPDHVTQELNMMSSLAYPGDWIVVCDTTPLPALEAAVRRWVGYSREDGFVAVPVDRFGLSNHRGGWITRVDTDEVTL
jgi:cephalosporin hydroxylase